MNFADSVKYLYGLGNEVLAMKLGLEDIGRLLRELGNPHSTYRKIQIAGTNGKGSTVAFIEAMCVAAGLRVGATVSPHLVDVTERVRIGGCEISKSRFAVLATRVREVSEALVARGELQTVPTFFEQVTAIALLAFADAGVELAILETGLGGRFDATTAAGAEIAAVTRIDLDHQRILGDSIELIAAEKAAIIKPGQQAVVIGEQRPNALAVMVDRCRSVGADPIFAADVIAARAGDSLDFRTKLGSYRVERIGLAGEHQIENAKNAILLAEAIGLSGEPIVAGLQTAAHRGRLERIGRFLLDGAHNENGARALSEYLRSEVTPPVVMIFGAMRDKDVAETGAVLFPIASTVIVVRADNARSMDVSELGSIARRFASDVRQAKSVREAIRVARETSPDDATIVVTGSLYLVGEALAEIRREGCEPRGSKR